MLKSLAGSKEEKVLTGDYDHEDGFYYAFDPDETPENSAIFEQAAPPPGPGRHLPAYCFELGNFDTHGCNGVEEDDIRKICKNCERVTFYVLSHEDAQEVYSIVLSDWRDAERRQGRSGFSEE